MITNLYRLAPHPGLLVRLGALNAVQSILQGLLLGSAIPILRALLQPQPRFDEAAPWLAAAAAGLVAYAVLTVLTTPVAFAAAVDLTAQIRHRIIRHVATVPMGWFTAEHKAQLTRATTADANNIGHLAVTIGAPAVTSLLTPLTIVAMTFAVDWRLALLLAAVLPPALLALRRAGRIAAQADIELEEAATELAGRAVELGQAQPVLRAAGQAGTGTARMRAALDEHRAVYRRGLRRSMVPDLTFTAVVMAGFAAVLVAAAALVAEGQLPAADLVALLVLATRFLEPLGNLVELIGAVHAMNNAAVRVRALLDTPALPTRDHPAPVPADCGVEFDEVTFTYPGARTPALRGVSVHCPAGSTTALVGPSGSGKTTITRLVARFFDPDRGAVRLGGVDLRELDPHALLDRIAIVFQDVYLFDDTIEENLRIARPDATRTDLAAAATAARLDEVIERLPDGWATRVGEGGSRLSGGERQRVAIARAFLKRAPIVLIDEAASALDPENEHAVAAAIAELAADPARTVLVIAHRPATIAAADRVVALMDGRVVEAGTVAELRSGTGVFATLQRRFAQAAAWRLTPADA
ncbi:ABC transporter ATP-binding protein [Nocardia farcinica]|uniref:Putative ABC transporter n=1 Tax=Nocardia farcinica (strain IFM 10152) TaxID=247156 RepID=Q5YV01_NOCFA|nr:ABC transporter ATP-binding protein [Nocardia farcinica]BAD57990.1 putative ABC transporter [Nocardia farcinica IFM 10152]